MKRNVLWLALAGMLSIRVIGQYYWMTKVENDIHALRDSCLLLPDKIDELQEIPAAERDANLVDVVGR